MKWHDHPLNHVELAYALGFDKHDLRDRRQEVRDACMRHLAGLGRDVAYNMNAVLRSEMMWADAGRPYYDVYPSVSQGFQRVSLAGVPADAVKLPLGPTPFLLRFAVGHELHGAHTVLCSEMRNIAPGKVGERVVSMSIYDGSVEPDTPFAMHAHTVVNTRLVSGETCDQVWAFCKEDQFTDDTLNEDMIAAVTRVLVAVCLIADDPDVVERQVLNADQLAYDGSSDEQLRARLIALAEQRGKRAWSVGQHVEAAPGFRRPHFGIRWCGPKRTEPKLRPIRGCIVRRRVVECVPTGRLGESDPSGSLGVDDGQVAQN